MSQLNERELCLFIDCKNIQISLLKKNKHEMFEQYRQVFHNESNKKSKFLLLVMIQL